MLLRDILSGDDPQVASAAAVIRAADADAIVLAGFDYDYGMVALDAFADLIGGYPHRFALRPNTGMATGRDLDGDRRLGGPGDAQGYGEFAGQGGLAILSRFPVDHGAVQDFSDLLWTDLPDAIPHDGVDPGQRLSTTAHWVVPLVTDFGLLRLAVWHASPPVFDGPEDRNGRRNHDEAAFWLRYLEGAFGPPPTGRFILAGFANLDPEDGDGRGKALNALLVHPLLSDPRPQSAQGRAVALSDGGVNDAQSGDPALDTADWPDDPDRPGNMRVDYLLPSRDLEIADAGVFWPAPDAPLGDEVVIASRHRLVWVDLVIGGGERISRAEGRD